VKEVLDRAARRADRSTASALPMLDEARAERDDPTRTRSGS